jgi:hypothetical protein
MIGLIRFDRGARSPQAPTRKLESVEVGLQDANSAGADLDHGQQAEGDDPIDAALGDV